MATSDEENVSVKEGFRNIGQSLLGITGMILYSCVTIPLFCAIPVYFEMIKKGDASLYYIVSLNNLNYNGIGAWLCHAALLNSSILRLSNSSRRNLWRYMGNYHLILFISWCVFQFGVMPWIDQLLNAAPGDVIKAIFLLLVLLSGALAMCFEPQEKMLAGSVTAGMKRTDTSQAKINAKQTITKYEGKNISDTKKNAQRSIKAYDQKDEQP